LSVKVVAVIGVGVNCVVLGVPVAAPVYLNTRYPVTAEPAVVGAAGAVHVSTTPHAGFGSVAQNGLVTGGGTVTPPALTVSVKVDCLYTPATSTPIVTTYVPVAVGVPEINPETELPVRPLGSPSITYDVAIGVIW